MTDTEKNVEREKKPAGATMFSFAGFAVIGIFAAVAVKSFFVEPTYGGGPKLGSLVVILPLIIGAIQRTTSDKELTWYKTEARLLGLATGILVGLTS